MYMFLIPAGVLFIPMAWVLLTYNNLIRIRNHCDEAWANIDTELKRRYNLIPNLVSTVKGYASHERELLEEVTRMRESCVRETGTPGRQADKENQLVGSLNRLLARVENYPELKASQNFLALQQELINTEDRIQAARRFFNGNVREMNNGIQTFPSSIVASMGGFALHEFFQVEDVRVRAAPQVRVLDENTAKG